VSPWWRGSGGEEGSVGFGVVVGEARTGTERGERTGLGLRWDYFSLDTQRWAQAASVQMYTGIGRRPDQV
jgi:hypothetical protein